MNRKLIRCVDAKIWAEEFVTTVERNPKIAVDVDTMTVWFANVLETGYNDTNNNPFKLDPKN